MVTYTILICGFSNVDIELAPGTNIVEATAKARELSSQHCYSRIPILLAADFSDNSSRCVWANEVAHQQDIPGASASVSLKHKSATIIRIIRETQAAVFAARKSAQRVIASRDHSLVAELRESLLDAIEVEPEMLKRLGIAPKVIAVPGPKIDGIRKIEKREVGKSLAQLLAEVAKETAEDRARELEMQDILERVADYAVQFENCQNPETFEIRFRPTVPRMIRKLKNDSSSLV